MHKNRRNSTIVNIPGQSCMSNPPFIDLFMGRNILYSVDQILCCVFGLCLSAYKNTSVLMAECPIYWENIARYFLDEVRVPVWIGPLKEREDKVKDE